MNPSLSPSLGDNLLLRTDSYKSSHWLQYPLGSEIIFSYIESRGGRFSHSLFFGLQAYLREYLSTPITHAHVDEASEIFTLHGEPFNEIGWRRLVDKHGGLLPLRIRAVPEGTIVPVHNVLLTVENTDPEFFWLTNFIETELLRAIWYPTTVATQSASAKAIIAYYLNLTSDRVDEAMPYCLHDFGARGVSSLESAALGGMAHLVNFGSTDTVSALLAARRYYDCEMAAYSIPAAEHSTITSWGREHEVDAYRNMLRKFARPGGAISVVSDSYDIFHACEELWGKQLRDEVIASGATLVIRPDSGDPITTIQKVLHILAERFGVAENSKGFKVLQHVRILYSDGIQIDTLRRILATFYAARFSAENVFFGMGGALLQQINRDTLKFALKCSAMRVAGEWRDVYKAPVGDKSKTSRRGVLTLVRDVHGHCQSIRKNEMKAGHTELLRTVFENGQIVLNDSFDTVRTRANEGLEQLLPPGMATSL